MAFAEDLVRLAAYTDSPAAKQFILHRVYMVYDGPSNGPRQLLESKMAYKSYEAIRAEDPEMCSPPDSWVEPGEWRLMRV